MKATTQTAPKESSQQGRYKSVDDAVQQKQEALLALLKDTDLMRQLGYQNNSQNQTISGVRTPAEEL